jgi:hypothetical protein
MVDADIIKWSDAFVALNEADRLKAQQDCLNFGTVFIRMKDDGSAEYVPLVDVYKTEAELADANASS